MRPNGTPSPRPLRLLMLSHAVEDPDAGAAGTSLRLAAALRAAGHEVTALFKDDLVPARPAGPISDDVIAPAALRTAWAIRRERFDVVDATGFLGLWLFPLLRTWRTRPLLVARSYGLEHADHEALRDEVRAGRAQVSRRYRLRGGGAHLRAVEWAVRSSDGFTCPAAADGRRVLVRGWRRRAGEVCVNGHGVTAEALEVQRRPEQPWAGRVVWCGTTVARKGWRDFVAGVSDALATHPLHVDVLGSGSPAEAVLADFPAAHRHSIRVHPRLPRDEQFAVMARADVFVSTSLSEGFHLALLEALAIGLPCVATRAGFLREEPRAAELAALIEPRAPAQLAGALRTLAAEPARRAALARAGRELARTRAWADVAERYLQWLGTLSPLSVPGDAPRVGRPPARPVGHVQGPPMTTSISASPLPFRTPPAGAAGDGLT
jgi:glycosyltransferase involved in cell wall biosynthesis